MRCSVSSHIDARLSGASPKPGIEIARSGSSVNVNRKHANTPTAASVPKRAKLIRSLVTKEARATAAAIHERGRVVFLTGGTGLYIRAFLEGLIETGTADRVLRERLENEQKRAAEAGDPTRLHKRLAQFDADAAERIHPNDIRRTVRALEILEQSPDVDTVLVSIGGGGLISGIATALKGGKPGVRVIGVEPTGAPTLKRSVEAGRVVELEAITTDANTLAPRRTEQMNLDIVRERVDDIVLVEDDDMRDAARWLWFEMSQGVELAGAAALAAIRTGKVTADDDQIVAAVVNGNGTAGIK